MEHSLLAPQRTSGIPDTLRLPSRAPRTTITDRIALNVGLRLLIWSTRPFDHERQSRIVHTEAARSAREHAYLREAILTPSR
ncbi:hypothetical protein JOD63_001099 [Microbacterium terrae]|uniref:Uncharacterized protein n=1 Tax=Microbacterium terrae TaxID=69369 RepID=A0A0M2H566_9MICO|nr:hypothetical protein [Microbacterium terrae]KJL38929.1 hypothetical protein RS81_02338 [Microbacterium terrae]MBP1077131.1 hypothetical protein [Microbacterium terrae]GLJ99725.1 hypothetical protein GCM10017594_29230 [Microbacterium terrae]